MTGDLGALAARLMLSAVFLWSGVDKAVHWSSGLEEIVQRGLPFATLLLAMTVVIQFCAGLGVALGIMTRLSALALLGFSAAATLLFHAFWLVPDPVERQHELNTFLEHICMMGGFLVLILHGPGALSLERKFRAR